MQTSETEAAYESKSLGVSLQISLTPVDIPHAALILPHQLRIWAPQCAEVLLVWDLDAGPRYARDEAYRRSWDLCSGIVDELSQALKREWPGLRVLKSSFGPNARQALSTRFFVPGTPALPAKDFRGGPFAAYFFALTATAHDYVLHFDSDMMFGGRGPNWVESAMKVLADDSSLLCVSPPGGPPPHADSHTPLFTTRSFLLDRRRLEQALTLRVREPLFDLPEACAPTFGELPEHLLSDLMRARELKRQNFAGSPGIWSLHPPVPPTPVFLPALPQLLQALSDHTLPEVQGSDYNLREATLLALQARA